MRLLALQQTRIVTAGMAAVNQPALFFDGCNPEGWFVRTEGDEWLPADYIQCTRTWPITLFGFTVRILTVLNNPRAGWHIKLITMIDDHRYEVLEEGIQSILSSVSWHGSLPLEWGFGVVMNNQLIATDRISVRAHYGVKDG